MRGIGTEEGGSNDGGERKRRKSVGSDGEVEIGNVDDDVVIFKIWMIGLVNVMILKNHMIGKYRESQQSLGAILILINHDNRDKDDFNDESLMLSLFFLSVPSIFSSGSSDSLCSAFATQALKNA